MSCRASFQVDSLPTHTVSSSCRLYNSLDRQHKCGGVAPEANEHVGVSRLLRTERNDRLQQYCFLRSAEERRHNPAIRSNSDKVPPCQKSSQNTAIRAPRSGITKFDVHPSTSFPDSHPRSAGTATSLPALLSPPPVTTPDPPAAVPSRQELMCTCSNQ